MHALRRSLRGLAWLAATLLIAFALYVAYAHWAWRDLPATVLEARYGDAGLQAATVDGVTLRYRLEGDARQPLLVLVHSHYFDMGIWDEWVPALTDGYRVLRYDLPGHGLTGPDPGGIYTVARDVELLDGLLRTLGLTPAAIAGSSLGGNIAFTWAARQPETLRALALMNSGGLKRAGAPQRGEIPPWADQVMPLIPPRALEAFLSWMTAGNAEVTAAYRERFVDLWRRDGNRIAELARLRQFETGDPEPLLAAIDVPVLILWGEANPQLPVALAEQFAQRLTAAPSIERRRYPGIGHVLPLEHPRAAADLRAFLDRALDAPDGARP